jgi:subtilisin family serine protease
MSFQVRGPRWPVVASATAAVVFLLAFSVSTQGPTPGNSITQIDGAEAVEAEVLVKYRDDSAPANHAAIEAVADADVVETIDQRGVRRMRSRRLRTAELLSLLSTDPDVEYVEPNYVVRLLRVPDDPSFTSLWGLFNNALNPVGGGGYAGADIDAPAAWDTTTGSRANVIAILDTGIDYSHADLAANIWSAPSPFQVTVGGQLITCAAGTHGFNAITRTCNPLDDHFHGTHAAGTIGAVGNNGVGVVGVNWIASMMAVKVLGSTGTGTVADAVAGLEFVMQTKAAFASTNKANVRVLSNSWGGSGYSVTLLNAINAANASDMLFVAAAGNDGTNNDVTPVYPASYQAPNVVAVASSTNIDQRSPFSNYGAASVDLAAPGSSILSTVPGNAYGVASGTSMATPHVSGAALLALSMCEVSPVQLKWVLIGSALPVGIVPGTMVSGGRLSLRRVLEQCPQKKVMSLELRTSHQPPQRLGTTVTWSGYPTGGQGTPRYRWYVRVGGGAWVLAQDWSTVRTFAWTPDEPDDSYQVMGQVRSPWNTSGIDTYAFTPFPIKPAVSSATLSANRTAPQPPGTTVTWTATASGGEAPYQYRFLTQLGGSGYTVRQSWSTDNTFEWTPSTAGANGGVMVEVRGASSIGASEYAVTVPFAIQNFATVTLTAGASSPRTPGTTVLWSAVPAGGDSPFTYQFLVWNGVAWTVTRQWSTTSTWAWTPTVANPNYKVAVHVRSAWNTATPDASSIQAFPIVQPVTSVILTPDKAAPRGVGTTVTFTAAASGGQGPHQYQWSVYDGVWTIVRGWSTNNVFVWTPTVVSPFQYRVKVEARPALSTGAAERATELYYPIMPVVTAATITPTVSAPQSTGTTIRWTASASGGQGPYRYQWLVWNGSVWTIAAPWSSANTFDWTPTVANPGYKVAVNVRGSWNTAAAEYVSIQSFAIQ